MPDKNWCPVAYQLSLYRKLPVFDTDTCVTMATRICRLIMRHQHTVRNTGHIKSTSTGCPLARVMLGVMKWLRMSLTLVQLSQSWLMPLQSRHYLKLRHDSTSVNLCLYLTQRIFVNQLCFRIQIMKRSTSDHYEQEGLAQIYQGTAIQ